MIVIYQIVCLSYPGVKAASYLCSVFPDGSNVDHRVDIMGRRRTSILLDCNGLHQHPNGRIYLRCVRVQKERL